MGSCSSSLPCTASSLCGLLHLPNRLPQPFSVCLACRCHCVAAHLHPHSCIAACYCRFKSLVEFCSVIARGCNDALQSDEASLRAFSPDLCMKALICVLRPSCQASTEQIWMAETDVDILHLLSNISGQRGFDVLFVWSWLFSLCTCFLEEAPAARADWAAVMVRVFIR